MNQVGRSRSSINDWLIVVVGYAVSFSLPGLVIAGILEVREASFWASRWDDVLRLIILGPSLAGPFLFLRHWFRGRGAATAFSGATLWCGIGVLRWIQVSLYYLCDRYDYADGLVLTFKFMGPTCSLWTLAVIASRNWRHNSWLYWPGVVLGAANAIYFDWNLYVWSTRGIMNTL